MSFIDPKLIADSLLKLSKILENNNGICIF